MAREPHPDAWINVEGSPADAICAAVVEYASLYPPREPIRHRVDVRVRGDRASVAFAPPVPPYTLVNLIGWLADPDMTRGSRGATGGLVAPVTGLRYVLAPDPDTPAGDTLLGVDEQGGVVSVYLPECRVTRVPDAVRDAPEVDLLHDAPVASSFEIVVDGADTLNAGFVEG
jgi:hypothetical protein